MVIFYNIVGVIIGIIAIMMLRQFFLTSKDRPELRMAAKLLSCIFILSCISIFAAQFETKLPLNEFEILNPLMLLFFFLVGQGYIYIILNIFKESANRKHKYLKKFFWPTLSLFAVYAILFFIFNDTAIYSAKEFVTSLPHQPLLIYRCVLLVATLLSILNGIHICRNIRGEYKTQIMDNFSQADFKQYLGLSKFQWSCEILVMWILLTYFYTSPILEVISCSLIAIIFAFQFKGFCNYCHYQNTIPPYFLDSDRNIIYESNSDPLNLEIEQKLNDWAAHESKPFTTQGLTIGDVAKDIGISPYKLSSYLNSNGSNFRSWINNLRIVESKKMLITNKDLSISEIAYSTGFCDLPAFSHAFKKTTGISPKHFKSKLT